MQLRQLRYHHRLIKNWFWLLGTTVFIGGVLQSSAPLMAQDTNTKTIQIINQAFYTYSDNPDRPPIQGTSVQINTVIHRLIDPFGTITGCANESLPDYQGFSVGLYNTLPSDPTGTSLSGAVALTPTEVPDIANNKIALGIAPNKQNSNPFFLTNSDRGTYNFLLDPQRGQIDPGKTYILIIKPPANSIYDERRIKLTIGAGDGKVVPYTATSLDGKPINATDNRTSVNGTINVEDAERVGLSLAVFDLSANICQAQEVQILKTGDRAAAEPGDTVIYRLAIKNLSSAALNNVVITDVLPLGFNFLSKSVRAEYNGAAVPMTATRNGSTITFKAEGFTLPQAKTRETAAFNLVYAAVLTPDAVRGTGENLASVNGQRVDNGRDVKDGPAKYRLRIQPGIVSDCGTIIGRVFVDKNFDGEQQQNEPGIPNAVIYTDDGNRIITDPNGLFSVTNVVSGYRTAVLDLSSLPGYALAPNSRFKERNSQSRLVHLEPSGLVRINFGVTPAFQEKKS